MKKLFIVLSVSLLLMSCAGTPKGNQEFDLSQELMLEGNYIQAIAYLKEAIKKEPEENSYKNALLKAEANYLRVTMKVVAGIESRGKVNLPMLEEIDRVLREALRTLPNDQRLLSKIAANNEAKKTLADKVQSLYVKVQNAMQNDEWLKVKDGISQIQSLYPSFESIGEVNYRLSTDGVEFYLNRAKEYYAQPDLDKAEKMIISAGRVSPDNTRVHAFLEQVRDNNNIEYYLKLAGEAFERSDWSYVVKACEMVFAKQANHPVCREWIVKGRDEKFAGKLADAEGLLKSGYIYKALQKYYDMDEEFRRFKKDQLSNFAEALITYTDIQIERLVENSMYGTAWYLFQLVSDVRPVSADNFERNKLIEDVLRKRVTKSIAVFDFKSPSYDQDSGILIANKLISNLFNNASNDTNVLEREGLKSILEEMKLGQVGVVSQETAKEIGHMHGIDMAIMGSVLLYKVDATRSVSSETVRYQVGEEIKDNIDYVIWKEQNPRASAEDRANAPTPKLMSPVYAEKEYEVAHEKKVGFIELSFRIIDITTGTKTLVETIEEKLTVKDSSNAGVRDAGVEYDPMEILTDTEILQTVSDTVVDRLSRTVLEPLYNREKAYFDDGKNLFEIRKESLNAIEQFVNALFNEKVKSNTESPITTEARRYMDAIADSYRFTL